MSGKLSLWTLPDITWLLFTTHTDVIQLRLRSLIDKYASVLSSTDPVNWYISAEKNKSIKSFNLYHLWVNYPKNRKWPQSNIVFARNQRVKVTKVWVREDKGNGHIHWNISIKKQKWCTKVKNCSIRKRNKEQSPENYNNDKNTPSIVHTLDKK